MSQNTAFVSLITSAFNRPVNVTLDDGSVAEYKIARFDSEEGKLKSGDVASYVILQSAADEATVISVHPQRAKTLVSKGEVDNMKMVEQADDTTTEQPATEPAPAKKRAGRPSTKVKVEKVKVDKGPSKKERAIELVNAMRADGAERKDIIAKMTADFEMSEAAAATYYQAIKSGKWTAS